MEKKTQVLFLFLFEKTLKRIWMKKSIKKSLSTLKKSID